jgi:hypothetical protein
MRPTLTVVGKGIPAEYFTPEARALCARVSHKVDLTDKELMMLALVRPKLRWLVTFIPANVRPKMR